MPKRCRTNDGGKVENAWNCEVPKFKKGDMKHKLLDVTTFQVNFPEYREAYLKASFPVLKETMNDQGIKVELDALKGQLTVSTTSDTWDPYAIMLARDVIKLISRNVPIPMAVKVFNENTTSEIIQIKNMCSDEETFVKRRNRLLGRDNQTLEALEKLTKCSMFVQGGTVAIIGSYEGTLKLMGVIKQCMKNVHPLHTLNSLFIENELKKDPDMKDKNWAKDLPMYKPKSDTKKKKKKPERKEKSFNPMPPPQPESKMDQQLAQGEYFIAKHLKSKPHLSKEEQKRKSEKIQAAKRAPQYQPPEEPVAKKQKVSNDESVDLEKLKKKVKKQKKTLAGEIKPAKTEKPVKDSSGKSKKKKKSKK